MILIRTNGWKEYLSIVFKYSFLLKFVNKIDIILWISNQFVLLYKKKDNDKP